MSIKEIVELAPNNIAFIAPPIWADILFVILLCGFVVLIPLASLLLIFLLKKIKILKEDKLLSISFSFIIYSASYLIFIILDISIYGALTNFSRIHTNIPGIIFSESFAYLNLSLAGLIIAASLLVGNLIWFLIRRRKIIVSIKLEGKSVESE